jgi:hypothetical protein
MSRSPRCPDRRVALAILALTTLALTLGAVRRAAASSWTPAPRPGASAGIDVGALEPLL